MTVITWVSDHMMSRVHPRWPRQLLYKPILTGAHCTVTHSYNRRENLNDLACLHRSAACQSELALFHFTGRQHSSCLLCRCFVLAMTNVSVCPPVTPCCPTKTMQDRITTSWLLAPRRTLYFRNRETSPEMRKGSPRSRALNKRRQEKLTIFKQCVAVSQLQKLYEIGPRWGYTIDHF